MTTIDDLRQTFFEESAEGLDAIDVGLNDFNESSSEETVNAVFRAIHSIKGGAGVFGFGSLVDFAHVFETVLDQLRHGKLAVAPHVVEVLQKANDTLSDLVAMARNGEAPPANFDTDSRAGLTQLIGGGDQDGGEEAGAADLDDIDFQPVLAADTAAEPQRFALTYRATQAQYDNRFAAVVKALRAAGQVLLRVDTDAVPRLDECDPQQAYIVCTGTIDSELALNEIREIVAAIDASESWSVSDAADVPSPETPSGRSDSLPAGDLAPSAAEAAPARQRPEPAEPRETTHAKPSATTLIRVDLEKVDRVVNMVGELVISQTMLGQMFQNLQGDADGRLAQVMEDVFLHTRELKNSVMAMRAQPVRSVFQRMSRLVRELSVKTGKRVRLETFGEGTEVDKTVIERLSDPLTHIIRNSMDHGIEIPERRRALGKSEEGTITLLADQRSSRIIIEISDDGAGIDPERVIKKGARQRLDPDGRSLERGRNQQSHFPSRIFHRQRRFRDFGARRRHGRGPTQRRRPRRTHHAQIHHRKRHDHPARITADACGHGRHDREIATETYVMPISSIVECIRPSVSEYHSLLGTRAALRLRGAVVPIVYLAELFELAGDPRLPMKAR